ncbi:hypothetical protein Tco_0532052 [Tanacetum coccineum]
MGRGTWYYSLGVFLAIVDAFVRSEFEISSWRGARVDVRTYLLGGAIDGSEANGIIRDPKLELESSRFTFDLVPLRLRWSYKVRVGSNGNLLWEAFVLLGRKKAKTVFRMRNGHVEVYGYAFWVNQCTRGFHGVNEPGGVRVAREDDRGVTEGREDVREVFQQRGSRAKRKLSRCGRNKMGNEPILALPEGADDFVVLMKDCIANVFDFEAKFHLGKANVDVVPWSEAKNEFEIDVRRSDLGCYDTPRADEGPRRTTRESVAPAWHKDYGASTRYKWCKLSILPIRVVSIGAFIDLIDEQTVRRWLKEQQDRAETFAQQQTTAF